MCSFLNKQLEGSYSNKAATEVGGRGSGYGSKPCRSQKPLLGMKAGLGAQLLPLPNGILSRERKGCSVVLNSCSSKVRVLAWSHISFTNQLRGPLALWRVGTLGSHLKPDLSESPGADATAIAWPAVLYLIVRRGFLLLSGDAKWHGYSGALQISGLPSWGWEDKRLLACTQILYNSR